MKPRMNRRSRDRTFRIERGVLVSEVELDDGRTYTHRCGYEAFREVAYYIDEHAADGVTTNDLWENLPGVAKTQASVALEFMKERSVAITEGRRNYPASKVMFEDAMVEWHALAGD